MPDLDLPAHHLHHDLAAGDRKRALRCPFVGERVKPRALEVNGIGQDESGELADGARRDDLWDAIVRPRGGPPVDGVARRLGLGDEVHLLEVRSISIAQQPQEVGSERDAVMPPELVGHLKRDAFAAVAPV